MIGDLFQECERMNTLMNEMKRSMKELDLGLKGELTITSDMEDLSNSLFFDQVFKITNINLNPYNQVQHITLQFSTPGSSNLDQACICLHERPL